MNEIESEYEGEIVKVYVENGQPVQYGERLFAIRPPRRAASHDTPMFKKILIANRGEIALRVICACRELGIKTVAVYSEADENSLHVRFADEAVCIGPAREPRQLPEHPGDHQRRRDHRRRRHPSRATGSCPRAPYLAEVCEACHIKFIGPSADVIRLMGDKARARRVMKKAGVPVLPGSDGPVDSEERGLKIAKDIGFPVIIKAAAGGGGRGMRIVRAVDELGAGPQDRAARGAGGLRRRRRLPREVHRRAAPHRVPDPRRPPRQRRPPRRARVLDPAPPPEADRGGAVGGAHREAAAQAREDGGRRRHARCSTPTPARSSS